MSLLNFAKLTNFLQHFQLFKYYTVLLNNLSHQIISWALRNNISITKFSIIFYFYLIQRFTGKYQGWQGVWQGYEYTFPNKNM